MSGNILAMITLIMEFHACCTEQENWIQNCPTILMVKRTNQLQPYTVIVAGIWKHCKFDLTLCFVDFILRRFL